MKNGLISIGEAASYLNITTRTLRYYEEFGLLKPEVTGGKRFYSRENIKKMMYINELKEKGCSLKEIESLFDGRCCKAKFGILANVREGNLKKIKELKEQNKRIEEELAIIDKLGDQEFAVEMARFKKKKYKGIKERVALGIDSEIEAVWNYTQNKRGYSYDEIKDIVLVMEEEVFKGEAQYFDYIYRDESPKRDSVEEGEYVVLYARNKVGEQKQVVKRIKKYLEAEGLEVEGPMYMYPRANILCREKMDFLMICEYRIKIKG